MTDIMNLITYIYDMFADQSGTVDIFFLLLVILLVASKNKRIKLYFILPSIIVMLFTVNPVIVKIFVQSGFIEANRYVRLYWLLPVGCIIAYGATILVKIAEKRGRDYRAVCISLIIILMCFLGDYMFTEENFSKANNMYKLPDGVIEVVDVISEDVILDGKDISDIRIAVPLSLSPYIRQYNAEIKMLYGRNSETTVTANEVRRLMSEEGYNINGLQAYAKRGECNYVVLSSSKGRSEDMENYDYILVGEMCGYLIYKDLLCEENEFWGVD